MLSHPVGTVDGMVPWGQSCIDLTNETAFTLALLDDPTRWKQRLVETIEFHSTDRVLVTSSYQVELLPDLLAPFIKRRRPRTARVVLPITLKPKQPLLGFHLAAPVGTRVNLHRRMSIASIEAEYVERFVSTSSAVSIISAGLPFDLIHAICGATTGRYQIYFRQAPRQPSHAMSRFLCDALDIKCSPTDVDRWTARLAPTAEVFASAIGEKRSDLSTSENPLLALPELADPPATVAAVDQVVDRYADAVVHGVSQDRGLAQILGEYGRRWEVMGELEVPVGEPFTVKLTEHRPLEIGWTGRCVQRVSLGDASTAHIGITVHDPAVRIRSFEVRTPLGVEVAKADFEGLRETQESIGIYAADPDREDYVDVVLRLRPRWEITCVSGLLVALTLAAAWRAAHVPRGEEFIDTLALLAVPTTFVVAVLLLRERTALAERLQRTPRLALIAATITLWAVVLMRLAG